MIKWSAAALLLLATGAAEPAPGPERVQYAQAVVRQQLVVRIRQVPPPAAVQWKEKKGPKCVSAREILGASLMSQNSVDLILRDRSRVRASLESSCPALDYYYGFYITPARDGMICADRDIIRSRMGGECEIDRFRGLEPVVRR